MAGTDLGSGADRVLVHARGIFCTAADPFNGILLGLGRRSRQKLRPRLRLRDVPPGSVDRVLALRR